MANTKISQLTANTNPTGNEELVYAYNNTNGKMTLDTMKTFASADSQPTLVSWTNIKTINNQSILWAGNIDIQWGGGWADASYDAIVDASWTWDYTLVSAAIAAWKFNIFVKNWSYTETAWWDVYTKGSSFLRIIWESKSGVQVTFPNTITTPNKIFIDMRYGSNANFYMENVSFNIALSSDNTRFYDDNGWNMIVKNCSFTFDWTTGSLFNSNVSNSDLSFYLCDFISLGSNVKISAHNYNSYWCNFSSASWQIYLNDDTSVNLYDCNIDTYSLWWGTHLSLYNTKMSISWWTITWDLSMDHLCNSELNISSLQSTPSLIEAAIVDNSVINAQWYTISFWSTFNGARCVSGSYIKATTVENTIIMKWCVLACSTLVVPSNGNVSWCRFVSPISTINMDNNSIFMWNYANQTCTLNVLQDEVILVWNNMKNATLVDSWTWTVKANNIFAS